jgi:hypothetical protein
LYGLPGAAWPALRVQVESAGANALERERADRGGEPVTLGKRPGLIVTDGILVLYDDHTLVHMSATAVSEQDIRRAAESLAPADRSLAPPVQADPGDDRCVRLRICR